MVEQDGRPPLWRRIARLQLIALALTFVAALVLNLVMVVTDFVLHMMLYEGHFVPKTDLLLWPILFVVSPLAVLHATQRCFRFYRAATFVGVGAVIAGVLGFLCGAVEAVLASTPLSAPLAAAWLAAAGYLLIGAIGILVTAWIVEDETPVQSGRRSGAPRA